MPALFWGGLSIFIFFFEKRVSCPTPHNLKTSRQDWTWSKSIVYKLYLYCILPCFTLSKSPNKAQSSIFIPTFSVLTWLYVHAGGVGVSALSVEDDPGGCRWCVLRWPSFASSLLAAWVGCQGHLHTDVAEGCSHAAAQDHGRKLAHNRHGCSYKENPYMKQYTLSI